MRTHSENTLPSINRNIRLQGLTCLWFTISVLLFAAAEVSGQNYPIQVNIAVSPPYTTKISDYTSQPGKILATIRNISPTGGTARIYLTGSITGEGGISVTTEQGYKPAQPLVIAPGASVMLNVNNLGDVFDEDHLVFEGITENDVIMGNGLPEDYYTICLRAWDFVTDQPLSEEEPLGCSAPFNVSDIEPPVITQPICGERINPITPQSLILSWTHPAGAPAMTRYKITMVEVMPGDHSPEDAMNSALRPPFFQQEVTGNAFIYGPAQPLMVEGKTYAFRITAIDPSNKVRFRNNGASEVCSFKWKKEDLILEGDDIVRIKPDQVVINGIKFEPPPFVTPTTVKGKLQYKYFDPGENKAYSMAGTTIRLVIGQAVCLRQSSLSMSNIESLRLPPDIGEPDIFYGTTLATTKTDVNGNFSFQYYDEIEYKQLKLGHSENENGVFRVALLVIEPPQKNFYYNPEVYIVPEKGKVNDLGTVTAKVRSYELDITAKPQQSLIQYLNLAVGQDKLSSINLYLCRKVEFSYQVYPMDDGKLKGSQHNVDAETQAKFKHLGLKVVAAGVTGPDGILRFQRVVWHHDPTFQYYIMAESNPESDQYFTFGAPVPFNPPASVAMNYGAIDPSTAPYPYYFNYNTQTLDVFLSHQFPRIAGKVSSIEDLKPLPGVKVDMNEDYNFGYTDHVKAIYPYYKADENAGLLNCISTKCLNFYNGEFMITSSDGSFAFNDLTLLYSHTTKQVIGPYRKLLWQLDGYKSGQEDIGTLAFGKQKIMNNITMQKGAVLKGRVTDAESGDRVIAWVRQPGGKSYKCDRITGGYELPVLMLEGQTQQLIVEKQGYITDTLDFIANKAINHLDVKLYTIKRRLKVIVHVKGSPLVPIPNCWVHILNVNTNQNGYNYPIGDFTDQDGLVTMSFTNGGDNDNLEYKVRIGMHQNTDRNFETQYIRTKIPVSKNPTIINCYLAPAACIKGTVYAGQSTTSPVPLSTIRYYGFKDTLTAGAGANGYYYLNNFPVRRGYQKVAALKSQSNYIGDEKSILINKASNECVTVDFNLTVYDDMDITHLMGFPMEVSKLTADDGGGVRISGNITRLPANEQFSTDPGKAIPFSNVFIKAGAMKNAKGVPIAEPVTLPVKTDKNTLENVLVLNSITGRMYSADGISLDRQQPGSSFGTIKSNIVIPSTEFNINNVTLPEFWLAGKTGTGTGKMLMPVFAADPALKKPVTLPATGFWVCNEKGEALIYTFPEFPNAAAADPLKSFLVKDKLILSTTLHTNCNNVSPADLSIKLGNVEITKKTMTPKPTGPIKMNMGSWKLESTDFTIGTNGISLNKALIKAQMDISVQNLEITYSTVNADKTVADFGSIKILGSIPVNVTATNKGLSYINTGGGVYMWQLYATNTDGSKAGYISGLPGLEGQDLPVALIKMLSNGTPPTFAPTGDVLKMYNLVDFYPTEGTSINIYDNATPPWFKVQGIYKPHLPYIEEFNGNIAWVKQGTVLDFRVDNPNKINFTHNNMLFEWDINTIDIQTDLFTAKGTATEAGKLGPVDIVLMHKTATSEIDIPANARINITQDKSKYFNQLVGGMEVNRPAHQWGKFWFEGVMVGMNAISNNPQNSRLKFICEGDIKAEGQSINVSKLDAFPGMKLTYDIANSRLNGSVNIDKDLMGMHANGTANCTFDPAGWYLNIGGELTIPGIGGCGLFGLFGDYSAVPPAIGNTFGALKCIPPEFQNKVSGFLLQGTLTKQLIPSIEWGVTLPIIDEFVGVQINADVSMNARTWMSFDPAVNSYGISLLAEGNIGGGVSAGLFKISANANAQLGIAGVYYSNGDYTVLGCGSVKAGVSAEVLTPVGWEGVSLTSPDLGLKMKIGNTGTDFSLMLGSCGDNLCP